MMKQLGGTLIGFLAGLLVGLGLALAVAVYVTKVPVPFVDRGVSRKPTQDAIEAEKNRNWNPNAGLAGTKPAAPKATDTPAPAEGSVKAEGASTPAAAPSAAAPAAAPPSAPARSGDPLGDLARSRTQGDAPATTTPASSAASEGDAFLYFVQAGAFRTAADAEAQRAKLAMLGFDAKVTEREQSGQTVYRVRTGPYRAKADADATQAKLAGNSIEAALVRVQR